MNAHGPRERAPYHAAPFTARTVSRMIGYPPQGPPMTESSEAEDFQAEIIRRYDAPMYRARLGQPSSRPNE